MSLSNYDPGQELSSINFGGMIGGPLSAAVDAQTQAALATVDFIKSVGFTPDSTDDITGEVTPGTPVYVTFKYPKLVSPYVPGITGELSGATVANGGTGYTVGDVLTIGTGGATIKVTAVTPIVVGPPISGGTITAVSIVTKGSNNSDATGQTANGGTGSGATFDITAADKDPVPAVFEQMMLEVPILTMLPIPYLRIDYVEIDFHAKITSMEYRNVGSKFDISSGFSSTSSTNSSVSGRGKILGISGGASASNTTSINFNVNASYQQSVKEGHKIDKTYQLGVKVRASQDEMPGGLEKILGILEDAIVAQPVIQP